MSAPLARSRALHGLALATGVGALALAVAGVLPNETAPAAIAKLRARVGAETLARAMKEPAGSVRRELVLLKAMAGPGVAARPESSTPREAPIMTAAELGAAIDAAKRRHAKEALAARAAASGMTAEERRRAEENVNRGLARQAAERPIDGAEIHREALRRLAAEGVDVSTFR